MPEVVHGMHMAIGMGRWKFITQCENYRRCGAGGSSQQSGSHQVTVDHVPQDLRRMTEFRYFFVGEIGSEHLNDAFRAYDGGQAQVEVFQSVSAIDEGGGSEDGVLIADHRFDDLEQADGDRVIRGSLAIDDLVG